MYSLTTISAFVGAATNYQADGKRLLIFEVVAFDLATNKYNIWASENRNFLSYSM
jgi:hypothetical protein